MWSPHDAPETPDAIHSSSVVTGQRIPQTDIGEDARHFVIRADLPGMDPKEVEIWMDKGIVSIKGERASGPRVEGKRYSRTERPAGMCHRRFALPDSADPGRITAQGRQGVLENQHPETTGNDAATHPRRW